MSDAFVASVALKVATVLGLAIVTPMFVTHLVAFYRLGVFTHDEFGLRRTLFACCSLILIELSLAGALIFNDWRGDEARCYLVPSFAALAFVMAKQAQVVFLFSRARIVHLALRLHDRRLLWFRAGVIFTATLVWLVGFIGPSLYSIMGM
ncbi:hypothetical protein BASA81_000613 [Batrachochytrium salamandrivorans]|nr:hypothetical protein BASA81_000613 [Batrachochytrium salamandrivorans]